MRELTDADCQSCGACCQTPRPPKAFVAPGVVGTWANCTSADVARIPKRHRLKLLPVKVDGEAMRATPLRADGSCGFLRGDVGKRVQCAIYEHRPSVCRLFPAGSEWCRLNRRDAGLDA